MKFGVLVISLLFGSALFAQVDSLLYNEGLIGCSSQFFEEGEKLSNEQKTVLVNKAGKSMPMPQFMKAQKLGESSRHALSDLDNDGKNELVIYNFTNGAHCCEEYFVFKNIGPNKYKQVARTFAGTVCINPQNLFLYDFYEPFGYFFTCYACAYTDNSDAAPLPVQHVKLAYRSGKMVVLPGDAELKSTIIDNLGQLSEQPYEKLEGDWSQDNGLRKEFALNLVVYHYSFGKNMAETKKLFDKYYKFPDAKIVWTKFTEVLSFLRKNNDF